MDGSRRMRGALQGKERSAQGVTEHDIENPRDNQAVSTLGESSGREADVQKDAKAELEDITDIQNDSVTGGDHEIIWHNEEQKTLTIRTKIFCYSSEVIAKILGVHPNQGEDMNVGMKRFKESNVTVDSYFRTVGKVHNQQYKISDFYNFGGVDQEDKVKNLMQEWNAKLFSSTPLHCNKTMVVAAMSYVTDPLHPLNFPKYKSEKLCKGIRGGDMSKLRRILEAIIRFHYESRDYHGKLLSNKVIICFEALRSGQIKSTG